MSNKKRKPHSVTKVLPLVSQEYFIAFCEVVHLVSQHTTAAITFSSSVTCLNPCGQSSVEQSAI